MDKKTQPKHMLLTRDPPQEKRTLYRLKMKVWKKNIPRKWTGKNSRVAILNIRQYRLNIRPKKRP